MTDAPAFPDFFRVLAFDDIDSTNAEARRRAEAGERGPLAIWARRQSAGRGRRGRHWVSSEGNLHASFLISPDRSPECLRPPIRAENAMQVGFVASLAIADAMRHALPRSAFVTCKWPNDVLIEGRKVAGILIESALKPDGDLDWMIVGMGVNVAHCPDPGDVNYPITSMAREGAHDPDSETVLKSIAQRFLTHMVTWRTLGFGPVRRAWLACGAGLGKPVRVHLGTEILDGIFENLDEDGALILNAGGVLRRVVAGEVFPVENKQTGTRK